MKKALSIMYIPYRFLIFAPILGASTLFFGVLTVVLVQFLPARTASFIGGTLWSRLNSYLTPMFVKVIGRENVDPKQSYVVVSNHQSLYDIFVLYGWLGVDFKWVMKQELRKVPFLGVACEKLDHIYIDRSNRAAALASLQNAKKTIVNGTSVIFFPEGTRSCNGQLGEFKKGAFIMSLDLGIPVLPVSIVNTNKILPNKTLRLLPGRAKLVIHEPIGLDGYSHDNVQDLMATAKESIQTGLDRYSS
jgi:1-acyl-sn-glycerol-3-phosphate acyltransferase